MTTTTRPQATRLRYLSLETVADELGCASTDEVLQLVKAGTLPAFIAGSIVKIPENYQNTPNFRAAFFGDTAEPAKVEVEVPKAQAPVVEVPKPKAYNPAAQALLNNYQWMLATGRLEGFRRAS